MCQPCQRLTLQLLANACHRFTFLAKMHQWKSAKFAYVCLFNCPCDMQHFEKRHAVPKQQFRHTNQQTDKALVQMVKLNAVCIYVSTGALLASCTTLVSVLFNKVMEFSAAWLV